MSAKKLSLHAPAPIAPLGMITNPNARANVRRLHVSHPSGESHVIEHRTTSANAVHAALRDLRARGVRQLIVNGGDGTLSSVVSALAQEQAGTQSPQHPPTPGSWLADQFQLLPVCGGTNNSVARDIGVTHSADSLMRELARGSPVRAHERQTLRVRCGDGREWTGFIFSSGLIAKITADYYALGGDGAGAAAKAMVRSLARVLWPTASNRAFWTPAPQHIDMDGQPLQLPDGAQLTFASTIDNQILFFKPFAVAAEKLSGFNALVNGMSGGQILTHLWPIARGTYAHPAHIVRETHELTVVHAAATTYVLDGELFTCAAGEPVTIRSGPRVRLFGL